MLRQCCLNIYGSFWSNKKRKSTLNPINTSDAHKPVKLQCCCFLCQLWLSVISFTGSCFQAEVSASSHLAMKGLQQSFMSLQLRWRHKCTCSYILAWWWWAVLHQMCDVSGIQERRLFPRVGHLSGIWATDVFDEWKVRVVAHQHKRCGAASGLY